MRRQESEEEKRDPSRLSGSSHQSGGATSWRPGSSSLVPSDARWSGSSRS